MRSNQRITPWSPRSTQASRRRAASPAAAGSAAGASSEATPAAQKPRRRASALSAAAASRPTSLTETSGGGTPVAEDQGGDVVGLRIGAGELVDGVDERGQHLGGGPSRGARQAGLEALLLELLAVRVQRLGHAVAVEDHDVVGLELHRLLLVVRLGEDA